MPVVCRCCNGDNAGPLLIPIRPVPLRVSQDW